MKNQAINPVRSVEKNHMYALGIKTKKAYRKMRKRARKTHPGMDGLLEAFVRCEKQKREDC